MGARISSFRKRRVQKRIKEAGQMRNVVKAFEIAARDKPASETSSTTNTNAKPKFFGRKSKPGKKVITPLTTAKEVTKPKRTETPKWKKPEMLKIKEGPEVRLDALKETRRREEEKIRNREITTSGSAAHNIVYETMLEEEVCTECSYCHIITRDLLIECRVCGKTAHRNCLGKRGYLDTENQRLAAYDAEEGSDVGWSCPECEDVSQLLSPEQVQILMEDFDRYDMNQDNKFNFDDFKRCQPNSKGKTLIEHEFSEYDRDNDGIVSWEEFKCTEALRILHRSSQASLVRSLRPREIEKIKNLFRGHDSFNAGVITKQASERVLQNWRTGLGFVVVSTHTRKNKDTDFSLISWDRFIREHAFSIICARPNTVKIKPYVMSFGLI